MKAIGRCLEGLEEFVVKDTNGKKVCRGRVEFDYKENVKSVEVIYEFLVKFKFKELEEIVKKILALKLEGTVKVECSRSGAHDFRSVDVEGAVGKKLENVDLKNPGTIIYVDIVDDLCIVGKLIAKDLCKREYRVRISNQSINACMAYCLIRDIKKDEILLDPFCKDGVIVIEASLNGCSKVYGYDSNRNNIKNAEINSRLAKASVEFGNYSLDWLSTRFNEKEVDKIISVVPSYSKRKSSNVVEKELKAFFEKAKIILKGEMRLISMKGDILEKVAKEYGFKIIKKYSITKGDSVWKVFVLK